MSKIPRIPSLAAPKTLSKNNAVNSAAHDHLMRATWGFVKNIAHRMFFDINNPSKGFTLQEIQSIEYPAWQVAP